MSATTLTDFLSPRPPPAHRFLIQTPNVTESLNRLLISNRLPTKKRPRRLLTPRRGQSINPCRLMDVRSPRRVLLRRVLPAEKRTVLRRVHRNVRLPTRPLSRTRMALLISQLGPQAKKLPLFQLHLSLPANARKLSRVPGGFCDSCHARAGISSVAC